MAFARAIEDAYRRAGRDPSAALKAAQIAPSQLQRAGGRMTAGQLETLTDAAMRELDDESLGAYQRPLRWGSYGMLARASLSAPSLGVALKRWCRHHGLIADDVRLSVTIDSAIASVELHETRRLPAAQRELSIAFVLRNIHGIACWYIDSRIPLQEAQFPFEAPPHAAAYSNMFPAPVHFGRGHAAIRFDARYLELPLKRDEKALGHLLQRALPLTVLQYRRDRLIVAQARMALAAHPHDTHSAEGVAALLNMSTRTLHRQLKEEGATLQQLKDGVRSDRAKDLLLRSSKPVKQIAMMVGFRSEKSFIRAFRQWTGCTPGEFRQPGG